MCFPEGEVRARVEAREGSPRVERSGESGAKGVPAVTVTVRERGAWPVLVIGRHHGLVLREAAVRIAADAGAVAAAGGGGAVPPEFVHGAAITKHIT